MCIFGWSRLAPIYWSTGHVCKSWERKPWLAGKGGKSKMQDLHPSSFLPVLGQLHNADMWKRVCFWSALPVSHLARTVQYWRALKRKQWKQSRTKQESKICDPKFIREVFRKGAIEMKKHRKQECKTYPSHGPFWRVWKRTPEKRCQKNIESKIWPSTNRSNDF